MRSLDVSRSIRGREPEQAALPRGVRGVLRAEHEHADPTSEQAELDGNHGRVAREGRKPG